MENRYYLLENVKKPAELVKDYTAYKGAKSQLEDQLREEEPLFDCGDIRLRDLKRDTRKGHKYLHLLVDGTDSDFRGFEQYAESQEVKILGARNANDESLDELVDTYLPKKRFNVIEKTKSSFEKYPVGSMASLGLVVGLLAVAGSIKGCSSYNYKKEMSRQESNQKLIENPDCVASFSVTYWTCDMDVGFFRRINDIDGIDVEAGFTDRMITALVRGDVKKVESLYDQFISLDPIAESDITYFIEEK